MSICTGPVYDFTMPEKDSTDPGRRHSVEALPQTITVEQARAIDRHAIETLGLPGVVLMENAAINAASVVLDLLEDAIELDRDRFVVSIVCGGGHNAGDGYAMARQLAGFGLQVHVFAHRPIETLRGDTAIQAHAWQAMRGTVHSCLGPADLAMARTIWRESHVLVDALLGTGFRGPVRPETAAVIEAMNQAGPWPRILSVDVPSGLDADTGRAEGPCVRADRTVTFVARKAGFDQPEAGGYLGEVVVADIGLPDAAIIQALAGFAGR